MENSKLNSIKGLKICFIAGTLGVGGAERQLYIIVNTLHRLGAEVSLIGLNKGEYWEQAIIQTGISYYSLDGKGSKINRLIKIVLLLRKIKPDIIQSQHFYTNLYATISGWILRKISIGASRSDLKVEVLSNGIFGIPSVMWPKVLVVNSLKSYEEALRMGRLKSSLHYLPNALDTNKFSNFLKKPISNQGPLVLIAAGSLIKLKRFDKFIELVKRLKTNYECPVKGMLIGSGVLEEALKQYAHDSGLDVKEMEFILHTTEPEVYFQKGDIFILTSDFEGTPNVVLEAMACGLPVISTKVGNLPFFINDRENGFFFDGSVDNLVEIVIGVMNDKELLDKVSSNAIQKINDVFSIEALESNLGHIYESILK